MNASLIVRKEVNSDVRQSISLPKKPEEAKGPATNAAAAPKKKKYGLWDFTKFTVPYLWKGGFMIRF